MRLTVGMRMTVIFPVTTPGNWKQRLFPDPVGCTMREFFPSLVALITVSCQSLKVFLKCFTRRPVSWASLCSAVQQCVMLMIAKLCWINYPITKFTFLLRLWESILLQRDMGDIWNLWNPHSAVTLPLSHPMSHKATWSTVAVLTLLTKQDCLTLALVTYVLHNQTVHVSACSWLFFHLALTMHCLTIHYVVSISMAN